MEVEGKNCPIRAKLTHSQSRRRIQEGLQKSSNNVQDVQMFKKHPSAERLNVLNVSRRVLKVLHPPTFSHTSVPTNPESETKATANRFDAAHFTTS